LSFDAGPACPKFALTAWGAATAATAAAAAAVRILVFG
jgi:hypothetical protein